jgi:phospholipid transport system substrate-binding protein
MMTFVLFRPLMLGASVLLIGSSSNVWAADALSFAPPGAPTVLVSVAGEDATVHQARAFIQSVADRGIGFLSAKDTTLDAQKKSFRALLRESFDLTIIGRFALGKYWRVATPAERVEYQRLFEKMVVDIYTERFSSYDGQTLTVVDAKPANDTDVMVTTHIVPKNGSEKINVDWRVRRGPQGLKIVDVVVEGVSMSVTQRSDFASVIGRGNGDISVLIDHLKSIGK